MADTQTAPEPRCPDCGAKMILHKPKLKHSGAPPFWGCFRWPVCRGWRRVDEGERARIEPEPHCRICGAEMTLCKSKQNEWLQFTPYWICDGRPACRGVWQVGEDRRAETQSDNFGLANQFYVSVASNTCNVTEVGVGGTTIRLMPSEALELIAYLEAAVDELIARGSLGGTQAQDVTGGRTFPSLNQEYSDRRHGTFAHCRGCKVTYWDDVPNYGSLLCPRCWEFVLVRGWNIDDESEGSDE